MKEDFIQQTGSSSHAADSSGCEETLRLKKLSDTIIRKVQYTLVFGPNNKIDNLKYTNGWANYANPSRYQTKASEILRDKYSGIPYSPMTHSIESALGGTMMRGGNCGRMSELALRYFAAHPNFSGMQARVVVLRWPFDHACVELRKGNTTVYCDPWIGKTFIPDENDSHLVEIGEFLTQNTLAAIAQLSDCHLPGAIFPADVYHPEFVKGKAPPTQAIDAMLKELRLDLKHYQQALQNLKLRYKRGIMQISLIDTGPDSFVLSEYNKAQYETIFEYFQLLEMQLHHPNNPHITQQISSARAKAIATLRPAEQPQASLQQPALLFSNPDQTNPIEVARFFLACDMLHLKTVEHFLKNKSFKPFAHQIDEKDIFSILNKKADNLNLSAQEKQQLIQICEWLEQHPDYSALNQVQQLQLGLVVSKVTTVDSNYEDPRVADALDRALGFSFS